MQRRKRPIGLNDITNYLGFFMFFFYIVVGLGLVFNWFPIGGIQDESIRRVFGYIFLLYAVFRIYKVYNKIQERKEVEAEEED